MLNATDDVLEMLNSPRREIGGRVWVSLSSTEPTLITGEDNLKSFVVDRVGENGKFFGYGVSQKVTVELLDKDRQYNVVDGAEIKVAYVIEDTELSTYPPFYIKAAETKRDENTNTLTIVGYDALTAATAHTIEELALEPPYTMGSVAGLCAQALGVTGAAINAYNSGLFMNKSFTDGANLEGTETFREVLDDIAEATQTIYYITENNKLMFKDCTNTYVDTVDKSRYFELSSSEVHTLTKLTVATELGDNVSAGTDDGEEQAIKDNAFLIDSTNAGFIESVIAHYNGLSIYQFDCSWRGNPLYEVADWLQFECKDGTFIGAPLVNDTHTYNGGMSAKSSWDFKEENTSHSNSTTLGEALKETFAKVDKANKTIELVVSEVSGNSEALSTITQTTDDIVARVMAVEEQNSANNEEIAILKSQVDLAITAEDLTIEIQKELDNGTKKVETTTGYVFDENGLTIEKTDSEIKTQITDDGMRVYKNSDAVLVANNQGVKATDLHAITYLIIGNNSRLEDYGNRTGCFWIGG